jgi:hypothetical protein
MPARYNASNIVTQVQPSLQELLHRWLVLTLCGVEYVRMTGWNYQEPEHHASTGLPVSILLLSVLGISAYLLIGGSLSGGERAGSKVYLPVAQTQVH